MSKICTRCLVEKPLSEYHSKKKRNGDPGKMSRCRSCECEVKKLKYNPEKQRRQVLKKNFDLTPEDYESILSAQGGSCAICGTTNFLYSRGKRPHIDHCHQSGKIRGLLCGHCNIGLGQFFDNVALLGNAITYLKNNQ